MINGLTPLHHPCQALADLLTLRERFGDLAGLRLAYVGDGNNVARSLAIAGELAGIEVVVAAPPGYQLERGPRRQADRRSRAPPRPAPMRSTPTSGSAWETRPRRSAAAPTSLRSRLDADLLAAAKDSAVVLHCLPAHPGEEITAEVLYGERSAVWDQAENRLHAQKALLDDAAGGLTFRAHGGERRCGSLGVRWNPLAGTSEPARPSPKPWARRLTPPPRRSQRPAASEPRADAEALIADALGVSPESSRATAPVSCRRSWPPRSRSGCAAAPNTSRSPTSSAAPASARSRSRSTPGC